MNRVVFAIEAVRVRDLLEELSIPSKADLFQNLIGLREGYAFYSFDEEDHLDFILQFQGFFQEASYILEDKKFEWMFHQIYGDPLTRELQEVYYGTMEDIDHTLIALAELEVEARTI